MKELAREFIHAAGCPNTGGEVGNGCTPYDVEERTGCHVKTLGAFASARRSPEKADVRGAADAEP